MRGAIDRFISMRGRSRHWYALEVFFERSGSKYDGPLLVDDVFAAAIAAGTPKAAASAVLKNLPGKPKGRARAMVVPFIESRFLQGNIRKHVTPGDEIHTDGWKAYRGLKRDYVHETVDHHALEYVRGQLRDGEARRRA